MTEQKRRVIHLERNTPKSKTVIGVSYDDEPDKITVNGETFTRAEFESMYPDAVLLIVKYDDDERETW